MRARLKLLGYFTLFWVSFQLIIRAAFLIYNHLYSQQLTFKEILLTFLHGIKMDTSISGYFLLLTGLMLCISVFTKSSRWLYVTLNVLTVILILLACVIVVVDMELYRHWGFRLNTTPFFYLGAEAMGSIDMLVVVNLAIFFVFLAAGSLIVYLRILAPRILKLKRPEKKALVPLLLITAAMVIPIRGSFTVAPMNSGFVYFHKTKAFANHAAINVVWNFLYSLQSSNLQYPENFFDKELASQHFNSLYPSRDSTYHILKKEKPNVILFILESFTADVIEPLGGLRDVAPNMSALCKEGVLFDNFYSSGDRTDKGIISILSGYPAQPVTSIIKYPAKTQHLPYLNHHMLALGYKTSFVYGGDIDFANFRSYLTNCRFDHITTEEDFPDEVNYSKWGVHDHLVLERAFSECDTAQAPFFKVILTLSSHEPFDVPMTSRFLKSKDEESLFLNSCHYTDSTIGEFIRKAKQTSWWENTVVLFVADHGHRLPFNKESKDKGRFKIPFLITGGAVNVDTVIHTYAGQTDIANTLLAQLGRRSSEFMFSKNVLSSNANSFAIYFFNDGYGFVAPGKYLIYDNPGKQFLRSESTAPEDAAISKAYQQILFSDYNKR